MYYNPPSSAPPTQNSYIPSPYAPQPPRPPKKKWTAGRIIALLLTIFMTLLLIVQLSACAQSNTATYNFPEYNEFVEKMEEKYPKFELSVTGAKDPTIRNINVSGEIPPEDYYDIFIELIDLFLTGNGYDALSNGQTTSNYAAVGRVYISFQLKGTNKEEASFGSNQLGSGANVINEPYKGFYHWGIGLADGLSGNDNTTAEIWYQDGVFIRKILGSYEEELFDYREYFGFDA